MLGTLIRPPDKGAAFLAAFELCTEQPCPTMLHALARAVLSGKGITLLPDDEARQTEHRPYLTLASRVWSTAAALKAAGIMHGERVLLVMPTGWAFIETFLACQVLGAVPVPAYPPPQFQKVEVALARLRHIIADAGIRNLITDKALAPLLRSVGAGSRSVKRVLSFESLPEGDPDALEPALGEVAFLQYTSGSTNRPKGVVVPHDALVANIVAAGRAARLSTDDRIVSWLPLYHDMGLVGGLLWPIYFQLDLILMSPAAFLAKPERWLRAMGEYRGTLSAGPNFAYARCVQRVRDKQGLDLSSWRLAGNAAEPISTRTAAEFHGAFAECGLREGVMFAGYGLAESVLSVTFATPGEALIVDRISRTQLSLGKAVSAESGVDIVACGRAVPGHAIQIVDDKGVPVPERMVGEIVVTGPSLMRGYHGNEAASRAVLRHDGLHTGDLGYLAEGRLFVTGRAKDLIIVRGKNFFAEDVEDVVEGVAGVRRGRSVAIATYDAHQATDRVVVIVEGGPSQADARAALAAAIQGQVGEVLGLRIEEVCFTARGSIPKTPSGKRQRHEAERRYRRGTLVPAQASAVRVAAGALAGATALAVRRWIGAA